MLGRRPIHSNGFCNSLIKTHRKNVIFICGEFCCMLIDGKC